MIALRSGAKRFAMGELEHSRHDIRREHKTRFNLIVRAHPKPVFKLTRLQADILQALSFAGLVPTNFARP